MNDDPSQVGRLARMLQDIELGITEEDEASLSDEAAQQLQQAKRALGRLARLSAEEPSDAAAQAPPFTPEFDARPDSTVAAADDRTVSPAKWSLEAKEGQFPQRFGRFEIDEALGQGGLGVVLLARDPKLDHHVALKIPRSELLLSDEGRDRLLREARAATILSHPNIVPIYESGAIGVVPYISFGYCSGPTLAKWLEECDPPLAPRLAASIIARLAEAIQHAHSRGIVHRDLKPANVMLAEPLAADADDSAMLEALRVADFGLATSTTADESLTRTGSPLGTPAYMSPEQARGDSEIGPASDVFALGVMLYEMLTNTRPFHRETDLGTLRAVETFEPPAASSVNAQIPKDLSAIAQKCMQKQESDRYRSAQELEKDLARFLAGEPVLARPVGIGTRLLRWSARNPIIVGLLVLTIGSLATGLGFALSYANAARRSELAAIKSAEEADRRYNESQSLAGLFHKTYDSFREVIQEDLRGKDDKAQQLKRRLVDATREHYRLVVARRPADREVLREYVDMLRPMAYQLQLLGDQKTSAEIWEEAADILESEYPDEVHEWAAVMGKLVEDYTALQRPDDAVAVARRVVAKLTTVDTVGPDSRQAEMQLVKAMTNSAIALRGAGKFAEAREILNDAEKLVCDLESCKVEDWPVDRTWARLIRTKCEVIGHLNQFDELSSLALIGISQYEALRKNPKYTDLALDSLPTFYGAIATVHSESGEYEEAIKQLEKVLNLQEELIERHSEMGWLYLNLANSHQRLTQIRNASGNHAAAIVDAEQLIDRLIKLSKRFTELKPACNRRLVDAYWIWGFALYENNQKEEAIEAAEKGIGLVEGTSSDQVPLALEGRLGTLYSIKAFASEDLETKTQAVDRAIHHLQHALDNGGSPLYQVDLESALKLRRKLSGKQ